MYYLYVLKSNRDGKLYIGSTNDLVRRLKQHNAGHVPATKPRVPFTLKYYEAYASEEDARQREGSLKRRGNARVLLLKRIGKSVKID